MLGWEQSRLKRRASDSSQLESDGEATKKRARCEERSSSLPCGQISGVAGYSLSAVQAAPQLSSNTSVSTLDREQSFSTPAANHAHGDPQSLLPFANFFQQPGWVSQNIPGKSDASEQTMEDVSHSVLQTPQSEETRREYQDLEMATDMQRCNSAPDLRILLDGQINPVPALNRLPVMASSSVTGAIVPFKAPQDVIRDAVIHQLRKNVHGALEEKHRDFGLTPDMTEDVGGLSAPCALEDEARLAEECNLASDSELAPMDIVDS